MHISLTNYYRFAKIIGLLLMLYSSGILITFAMFVLTGVNTFQNVTNDIGMIFFGLIGTFSLPLGIALMRSGTHIRLVLVISGMALGINGLLRLSLIIVPELREIVGSTVPLTEFIIFTIVAMLSILVHPHPHKKTETQDRP